MTVYHILSSFAALIVAPLFALYSLLTGNKRRGLLHHFGLLPATKPSAHKKTLWAFALSLGEVTAAAPVLKIIHEERPDIRIVVSVTTDSGYDGARQKISFADAIFFHPFDCLPFTLNALKRIQPDVFLVADTGFWPGLLDLLQQQNIPALLFNGRISKRSLKRYQLFGSFATELFSKFDRLCMQSKEGSAAIKTFGVEESRLQVIGDPKFDALKPLPEEERRRLRAELGIQEESPVWVAGSTHAGEEEIVLQVYQKIKKKFSDLILILAPRRIERVEEIASLLQSRDISFVKRSALNEATASTKNVILLDTLGELANIYAIADAAFVGKSLLPPGGGHSLMEPVAQGVPVLHGPFIENIRHLAEEFQKEGLALETKNAEELETVIRDLLENPDRRKQLAEKAFALIQNHQGASRRMAEIILEKIKN